MTQVASEVRPRVSYHLLGVCTHRKFNVHNNSITNLGRAVTERVFNVETESGLQRPPQPSPGVWDTNHVGFFSTLLEYLPSCHPLSHQQFVDLYEGRRKQVYQRAVESLSSKRINRKDAMVSPFVKAEKIPFYKWHNTPFADPCPRVIQARGARYNVEVGCYLKPLEKRLFKSINKAWGCTVVMKGLNAQESGTVVADKWGKFLRPVAIGLDMKRFDQHVSQDALRFEHAVYTRCFHGDNRSRLAELLSWQLTNTGIGRTKDGRIKYTVEGCRMSGDMNTSMGNVLLMCTMAAEFRSNFGRPMEYINNGDDCVFICESADAERMDRMLRTFFLPYGFTAEVEAPVSRLEEVVFCQTQPVWTPSGWLMVRDPRVCLSKDTTCISLPLDQGNLAKFWMQAIGDCGMSLSGGVPVLQDFYSYLQRCGCGMRRKELSVVSESGMYHLATGMHRSYGPVHPVTRVSFYNAFRITPDEQIALEEHFKVLRAPTCFTWRDNKDRPHALTPIYYGP